MDAKKPPTCVVCKKEEHGFDRVFNIPEEITSEIKSRTNSDDEFLEELDKYVKEQSEQRTIFDEVCGIYEGNLVGGLVCSDECKATFEKNKENFYPEMIPVIVTEKEEDNETFFSFN